MIIRKDIKINDFYSFIFSLETVGKNERNNLVEEDDHHETHNY